MSEWGHRFWILNPAMYQLESKEGTGLIRRHAERLWGDEAEGRLAALPRARGGDYMRMWTRVLVEDNIDDGMHLGRSFDAYYFLGRTDVQHFFSLGGATTSTAGIEEYFARKYAMDPDFRDTYSVPGIEWDPTWERDPQMAIYEMNEQRELRDGWEQTRKWFFRFYSIRASANFSLGCHDEWNIFRLLNEARLKHKSEIREQLGDVGDLLAGYFDGRQIDPGATVTAIAYGYEKA